MPSKVGFLAPPRTHAVGHKPSFPAHSEFLPRSAHEWQVCGDESEPQFGWTRPQAGIQQWPVWGGLIRRVAVDSGAWLPMYRCPNFGGELKIIAAILEQPVI
jgi:hypothetical protein